MLSASKLLSESLLLHEEVSRVLGPSGAGRVNLAVGVFEHDGRPLPVTILETQMGCSAQDINAWEALVNSREDGYTFLGKEVEAKGISVIRAGTCGGIIISEDGKTQTERPIIEIGDVINAQYSIGDGAVVRQRLGCGSALDPRDMKTFRQAWMAYYDVKMGARSRRFAGQTDTGVTAGRISEEEKHIPRGDLKAYVGAHFRTENDPIPMYPFTKDRKWPISYSSPEIVNALSISCSELGLNCHLGGNFTKESLYLESDEDWVRSLRTKYGALSTEMEHFGLAFLAMQLNKAGIRASNGLISCVVGTVPGGSFAAPGSNEEARAKESEERMLESALLSLWKLAYWR